MSTSDAERFAAEYAELRAQEGWAERDRVRGKAAIAQAIGLVRNRLGANAVIVDIGAGAQRHAGVIGIDLGGRPNVRGDMRSLPLRDASVDATLYAASLHYAPVDEAVAEAARVLRAGGLLVAIDSPIYDSPAAAAEARARSAEYYARAGHPSLADHYHPIEAGALRRALTRSGLELVTLRLGSRWRRLLRRGPDSLVLARKLR